MRAGLPKNVQALVDLVTESAPCTARACRACERVPKRPWMGAGSEVGRRALTFFFRRSQDTRRVLKPMMLFRCMYGRLYKTPKRRALNVPRLPGVLTSYA
jgi:hypothetical protein